MSNLVSDRCLRIQGTFELRTDQQKPVGKISVHLSVPGVHPAFDPTAHAVHHAMAADGLMMQATAEETAAYEEESPMSSAPASSPAADSGNGKYLLKSRVTINIPDARLPPSVVSTN